LRLEVTVGYTSQFVVDERKQILEGFFIAVPPLQQQSTHGLS